MEELNRNAKFRIEDNILKGREVHYTIDYESLGKFVLGGLEKDPNFVGQIDALTGEEYTYGKMRDRSVRCALWMRSKGLLPRDVVAICSEDCLDYAITCYATLYVGAIFNPWCETLEADGFCHLINVTKPKMIFVEEAAALRVAEAVKRAEVDVEIIVFRRSADFHEFESVIAGSGINEVKDFKPTAIESLDEIAAIFFSSGSTGLPKGVAHSHRNIMLHIHKWKANGMIDNIRLIITSTYGVTCINKMLLPVFVKTVNLIFPESKENLAGAVIEKYKINCVWLYPSHINRLLKSDALHNYNISSVTRIYHFTAPLGASSYSALEKLLPNAEILSIYGMTEAGGAISIQSAESKLGSCGEIIDNTQMKVIDLDTGRTLGVNERGEILIKSNRMMVCYYNDPQATAKSLDAEGWLRTADFGYYTENGEIFLIDRLQDIVRLEYYDVSPSEIESVILTHPGVQEAAVVGQPHDLGSDRLIAFVVKAENSPEINEEVTEMEIVNLVAAKLPKVMFLHGGVKFIDKMPRTPANKIRRIVLRDIAREL